LILLGLNYRKPMMVFWGFWIFALLDSVAGAAQLSERLGTFSLWWIELAILPFALVSVPILRWCTEHYPSARSPSRLFARPTSQPGSEIGSWPAGGGSTNFP